MGIFGLLPGMLAAQQPVGLERLHQLRTTRRESSLQAQVLAQASKAESPTPVPFGLLVIPVDFSDARLGDNWDGPAELSPALFPLEGQTLHHYFQIASAGKAELQIILAPLVRLSGDRQAYSDVNGHGFSRTRTLATEALTKALAAGVDFRDLDLMGSDGQVDGVLILHSAPGQENDPQAGLIQPLQFFLAEPVVSRGVAASFYAVASLHSGLGIWAHETGHLLGLEDRYDPLLHPDTSGQDVRSLGGLGRFSIMASGAWGPDGDGWHPALPDAYSCWQLGWTDFVTLDGRPAQSVTVRPWRQGGHPIRAWTNGESGSEFFLLETRSPASTYPFDTQWPGGQMLVYHVDESVPEGWFLPDGQGHHLRVSLVEADGDQGLATGEDDGRGADSFPGPLNVTELTPFTVPGTQGYDGATPVRLQNITTSGEDVTLTASIAEEPLLTLDFQVNESSPVTLAVQVRSHGTGIQTLTGRVDLSGNGGGAFANGQQSLAFTLRPTGDFWAPESSLVFFPAQNPQPGASTEFHFQFTADQVLLPGMDRTWVWAPDDGVFAFQQPDWIPWQQEIPLDQPGMAWHRWSGQPFLTTDGSPVLACTGDQFLTSAQWPEVLYGQHARAALISPALSAEIRGVQMIHSLEVEYLRPGTVMDGAVVFWQGPAGQRVPAVPLDGWDAVISPQSDNTLGGRGCLADSALVLDDLGHPRWRCDVFPLPDQPGPWQLGLELSSNSLWRRRGWFIARMKGLTRLPLKSFSPRWRDPTSPCTGMLTWSYPDPGEIFVDPVVEFLDPAVGSFVALPHQAGNIQACADGWALPGELLLEGLQPGGRYRHQVLVSATGPFGVVASRPEVVYPDGGRQPISHLEQPFPNPSRGGVKFQVENPTSDWAQLRIFDLRGRLVHEQDFPTGRHQVFWSGEDAQGRRLASGTYYLKLAGSGFSSTRKVVLIR